MSCRDLNTDAVAIVGYGYIGGVIGAVLADRGFDVVGIEPNARIRQRVEAGEAPVREPGLDELTAKAVKAGRLHITDDPSAVRDCSVILITVGTPLDSAGDADQTQIAAAAEAIAPHLADDQLVMLKSTVPPGCTTSRLAPILRRHSNVHVAFCPERLAEGNAIGEFLSVPVVVGGIDAASTEAARDFWQRALETQVMVVASATGAEMVKLADNLWIDLNIALANELAKLCDRLGDIDVLEVIKAANTLPKVDYNVNILLPSVGVGGYCLTKDPWFVHQLGKKLGLELQTPKTSRLVNDQSPLYAAELIDAHLKDGRSSNPDEPATIAVLGLSFKSNTGDVRFTPTLPTIERLIEMGYALRLYDPWLDREEAGDLFPRPIETDIRETLRDADCVAFFTGHREFHEFPLEDLARLLRPNALVFDGRMYFERNEIEQLRALGLRYKGVGR